MTKHLLAAFLTTTMAAARLHAAAATMTLVEDGQAHAAIVLADRPTRAAQMAAAELQHHIKLMTGAELPVLREPGETAGTCILVGATRAAAALGLPGEPLQEQEHLIAFRPDTLVLMGKDKPDYGELDYQCNHPAIGETVGMPDFFDERGTLHAAYEFLERFCGVRWYLPTELGTVYDRSARLAVSGSDLRRAPAMKYRYVHMHYPFPEDLPDLRRGGRGPSQVRRKTADRCSAEPRLVRHPGSGDRTGAGGVLRPVVRGKGALEPAPLVDQRK